MQRAAAGAVIKAASVRAWALFVFRKQRRGLNSLQL